MNKTGIRSRYGMLSSLINTRLTCGCETFKWTRSLTANLVVFCRSHTPLKPEQALRGRFPALTLSAQSGRVSGPSQPSTPAQERGVWDCNLTQRENSVYSLRAGRCASDCFGQRLRFQGSDGKVLTVVMLAVLIESQSEWPSQCAQRGMRATAEQTHLLTCTHSHLLSVYLLGTEPQQ